MTTQTHPPTTSKHRAHRPGAALLLVCLSFIAALAYAHRGLPGTAPTMPNNPPIIQEPQAPEEPDSNVKERFEQIQNLIQEQKYAEALEITATIREETDQAGNEPNPEQYTKALLLEAQLEMGLGRAETAVEHLLERPWPEGAHGDVVRLFYANQLFQYLNRYRWEIGQRQGVQSEEPARERDLKTWSIKDLLQEAHMALDQVWQERESWGERDASEDTLPVGSFLVRSTYPEGIRDTLRDRVTYLWVDILQNSSYWSPVEENNTFQLDLDALASVDAASVPNALPTDPSAHPLERAAALLGDLERWHGRNSRTDAELEARLERLRVLHSWADRPHRQALLRERLEQALERAGSGSAWWATGVHTLAEWTRGDESLTDNLRQARDIAKRGLDAYPGTVGGNRCKALIEQLELAEVQLEIMPADRKGARSILVRHRNTRSLDVSAYRLHVTGPRLLSYLEGRGTGNLRQVEQLEDELSGQTPVARFTVELPATPDLESHQTFVVPPLEDPGLYVLIATSPEPRTTTPKMALSFLVSDLVLVDTADQTREGASAPRIAALHGTTGDPVKNVSYALYYRGYERGDFTHEPVAERLDPDGLEEEGRKALKRWRNQNLSVLPTVLTRRGELTSDTRRSRSGEVRSRTAKRPL